MSTIWKFNDGTEVVLTREQEKILRRTLKRIYKLDHSTSYDVWDAPLTDAPRSFYDPVNPDDGWVQYGYFDGTNKTDVDVREYIDEYIRVRPPYSAYDCTGRPFTAWIDWHRNPCGLISYINHMRLDV